MPIVAFGVLRERVNISYETWRASHGLMAGVVAGLTLHHVLTSGAYSPDRPLRAAWIALAALAFGALLTVYVVRPWRTWRQGWRVDQVRRLGERTWEVTLRMPAGARFDFSAGQFIWLTMAPNRPPFHNHPFSIASAPSELPRLRLIVREAGDCTNDFGKIEPGTRVAVDGPHGSFTLDDRDETVVMVAGGVGIAPCLACSRRPRRREIRARSGCSMQHAGRRSSPASIACASCER
jgi:predicted ferric reductase